MNPILKKSDCRYGFLVYVLFFTVFLGIKSGEFHYNRKSNKGSDLFFY